MLWLGLTAVLIPILYEFETSKGPFICYHIIAGAGYMGLLSTPLLGDNDVESTHEISLPMRFQNPNFSPWQSGGK